MKTIILSSLTLLIAYSAPAEAQVQPSSLRDRIAEACSASDVDIVGKRLARECRESLRAQAQAGQEQLAFTRGGWTVTVLAAR